MSILSSVLEKFLQQIEGDPETEYEDELSVVTWDSSAIASLTYYKDDKVLEVMFNTGRRYEYYDVSIQRFNAFKDAMSIGGYFNYAIRDNYPYSRV